jgi:hypothetical protein
MWALTISISSAAEVILSSLWCVPLFNQCNMFMKVKKGQSPAFVPAPQTKVQCSLE